MGILRLAMKVAVAAGAAYTGIKVTEKFKANNPNGTGNVQDTVDGVKKAAGEFYKETAETVVNTVKENGPVVLAAAEAAAVDTAQFVVDCAQDLVDLVSTRLWGEYDDVEYEELTEEEAEEYETVDETEEDLEDAEETSGEESAE